MACKATARGEGGFTLIEVLSAVTILIIIIAATGRIYASVTKAYNDTMKQADRDANARAVMDFMAKELSGAFFENSSVNTGALVSMRYKANTTPNNFGVEGGDEIWFVTNVNEPSSSRPREALQVAYYMRNLSGLTNAPPNAQFRFSLYRVIGYPTNSPNYWNIYYAGQNGLQWSGTESQSASLAQKDLDPVVENVRTFEVFAYADEKGQRKFNWNSGDLEQLYCIDLYLETMSEADAVTAAGLAASLGQDHPRTVQFVENVVRRHYQRIHFPHKAAYYDGPLAAP